MRTKLEKLEYEQGLCKVLDEKYGSNLSAHGKKKAEKYARTLEKRIKHLKK